MLTYQAAYQLELGTFFGQVVDFPEATAFGATLSEARGRLASVLRYAAEQRLRRGELLPIPGAVAAPGGAYLLERLRVLPCGEGVLTVEAVP